MPLNDPRPIARIGGEYYYVESITEPCVTGRSYHYHEEDHPGVPHMQQHHHHDERCQRQTALLVPLKPHEFEDEIVVRPKRTRQPPKKERS